MTYWILTILLATGPRAELAYGSKWLCDRAANGRAHTCTVVHYEYDR